MGYHLDKDDIPTLLVYFHQNTTMYKINDQ